MDSLNVLMAKGWAVHTQPLLPLPSARLFRQPMSPRASARRRARCGSTAK